MATRRLILVTCLALVALAGSAVPVAATGTCQGKAAEYPLPAEQHDATLSAYDRNGDGIICVSTKGRRTTFADNRI
jgi:hypothetical protein